MPLLAGWGSTETAPCATATCFTDASSANIGIPLPGTEILMMPHRDKLELCVKGPNIMSGYWRDPQASALAFDERGFYRMGDAGRLVDPRAPARGILFDGRTSENFKLLSGTWVQVGALRLAVIEALRPLIQDVVVAGHDRDEIGLLLFPNLAGCREKFSSIPESAIPGHPGLVEQVLLGLRKYNASVAGSSARICRFLVMRDPPRGDAHEITDKGYINQRAVLDNRAGLVEALYTAGGVRVPD